jgi:hypothetical protein
MILKPFKFDKNILSPFQFSFRHREFRKLDFYNIHINLYYYKYSFYPEVTVEYIFLSSKNNYTKYYLNKNEICYYRP